MMFDGGEMERTGTYYAGDKRKTYKLLWSGKEYKICGVGMMGKEETCEKSR